MGALNIKDPAVAEKARRLAEATGKSITAAVSDALDESLRVVNGKAALSREEQLRSLHEIQERFKAAFKPGEPTIEEIMADMCDEHGAPK